MKNNLLASAAAVPQSFEHRQLEDDREYTPLEYHEWFGGPPLSTQAKHRMAGKGGCPFIKRGRRVTLLGRDIKEARKALRRRSTSDQGEAMAAA